jgi:hypothetical protein
VTTIDVERTLAQLRDDLHTAARRRIRRRRRLRYALFLPLALAVGVGTTFAVTSAWTGHDVSPADIERQVSVVTEPTDCSNVGCNGRVHKEVVIIPAMGVTFVFPNGRSTNLVPAGGFGPGPPPPGRKLTPEQRRYHWPELTRTGGFWSFRLPDGTSRRITWRHADGSMKITDTAPDGSVTVTPVHAGDVLPLVPDSIDPSMRTPEKAVTFDLPDGTRVYLFPTFNETYVGFLPLELREMGGIAEVMPRGEASRYGLVPRGEWNGRLPVTPEGGTWTVSLPSGVERTISWKAGDSDVKVTDSKPNGEKDRLSVPIGHELPLVPFR